MGAQWDNQAYIDITLPFGLRSAPMIFTALADGLQWILEQKGVSYVAHYLDDFITVGTPNSDQCNINQQPIFETCQETSSRSQNSWPHNMPGLPGNGNRHHSHGAPPSPGQTEMLQKWQFEKVCTRVSLESLLGHLNHACQVVRPGRSFIGRLITMLTQAKRSHHRMVRINNEARSDIRWWHLFVQSWNGISMLREHHRAHPDHQFWSDVSGS